MNISIIIVNYKSLEKTKKCLGAIGASFFPEISHEIIVVDNASGDNLESLKKDFPYVKLILSLKNCGMGGGNNLGIQNSHGDYILILNPDTFVDPQMIKILFEYLTKNPKAGIAGPKLLNPDGSLQPSCLRFPKFHTPILRRTFLGKLFKGEINRFMMADFDHKEIRSVDWMMGSCLMVRRSVMDKIGLMFDPLFFMFFEDTDLCRRVKKAGFEVIYNPMASANHDHARASAKGRWFIAPLTNKLARTHIASWIKYFWKWKFAP